MEKSEHGFSRIWMDTAPVFFIPLESVLIAGSNLPGWSQRYPALRSKLET
jgi:hypothetical protein